MAEQTQIRQRIDCPDCNADSLVPDSDTIGAQHLPAGRPQARDMHLIFYVSGGAIYQCRICKRVMMEPT